LQWSDIGFDFISAAISASLGIFPFLQFGWVYIAKFCWWIRRFYEQNQPGDSTLVGVGSFSRGSADVGAIHSGFGGLQQWPVVEQHVGEAEQTNSTVFVQGTCTEFVTVDDFEGLTLKVRSGTVLQQLATNLQSNSYVLSITGSRGRFAEDDEYFGFEPTSYDIHVFALNADLGPQGLINVSLVRNVPKGTFIVAYGQGNGKAFSVPFTEAGLKCSY
jgi:hypothetical protein